MATPLSIRFPQVNGKTPMKDEVKAIAAVQGVPVNQFMLRLVEKAIAEYKAGNPGL